MACVWARHVGLPIGEIVLATNANQTVTDFLRSGDWQPRASVPTLASAMDVGNPSNMERLRSLHPDFEELQGQLGASSVDDIEIRGTLRRDSHELNRIWCPHRSEEHTSELQSLMRISYAVFCLKKKKNNTHSMN